MYNPYIVGPHSVPGNSINRAKSETPKLAETSAVDDLVRCFVYPAPLGPPDQ